MTMVDLQRRFHAAVTSPGETAFEDWDPVLRPGLAVYRNAYRARLIECLRSTFEKTWTWIGDESFDAAAAHHLIVKPPQSWTLDDAGAGFDETLAQLFPNDPEVAELAWLEWQMQQAFIAADDPALDAAGFAALSKDFTEEAWASLRVSFVTGMRSRRVRTDCGAVWTAIATDREIPADILLAEARTLVVWRQGLSPRFRMLGSEAAGLETLQQGGTFGDMCETMVKRLGASGIEEAGRALGVWIAQGLVRRAEASAQQNR
ncbi:MAG: putative DNA-binding domain-containing protein [Sphingosinicella sp.]|nr:putative DNA-binding domain-containing protein [Sphingosinicella sp.]